MPTPKAINQNRKQKTENQNPKTKTQNPKLNTKIKTDHQKLNQNLITIQHLQTKEQQQTPKGQNHQVALGRSSTPVAPS
jgi:hypothetical protein